MVSPIHFPWSYELVRWWIYPPCIFGWIRRRARISSRVSFCSIRSRYQPRHVDLSKALFLLPDHIQRLPPSWTNTPVLGCLGMTSKWARRDWLDGPGSGCMNMCDGIVVSRPETSSPWWPDCSSCCCRLRRHAMRSCHSLEIIRVCECVKSLHTDSSVRITPLFGQNVVK